MELTSSEFKEGEAIPVDKSLTLQFNNVPKNTGSLAVVVEDITRGEKN